MSSKPDEPRDDAAGENSDAPDPQIEAGEADAGTEVERADATPTSDRRHLVRQRAKQVSSRQRRNRVLVRVVIAVVVVAAIAAAGIWIYRTVVPEVVEPAAQPENLDENGFLFDDRDLSSMLGSAEDEESSDDGATDEGDETSADEDASDVEGVTVDVYVDYLSPESGEFQTQNSAQLAAWVQEGAVSLRYHPVALMTAKSNGSRYSLRAMGAVACLATHDPDRVVPYNQQLLTDQPEVDTAGSTDAELADLAAEVGVENEDALSCIREETYADWAREMTTELSENDLAGTDGEQLTGAPMILVNGLPYTGAIDDPGELSQFVLTVESDKYLQSPEPEPSE